MDTDVEILRPLDDLMHLPAFTGYEASMANAPVTGYNFDIALLDHMSLNDIVFESYDVGTAVRELVDQGCNGKGYDKGKHDTDNTDNGSVFQSISTS